MPSLGSPTAFHQVFHWTFCRRTGGFHRAQCVARWPSSRTIRSLKKFWHLPRKLAKLGSWEPPRTAINVWVICSINSRNMLILLWAFLNMVINIGYRMLSVWQPDIPIHVHKGSLPNDMHAGLWEAGFSSGQSEIQGADMGSSESKLGRRSWKGIGKHIFILL